MKDETRNEKKGRTKGESKGGGDEAKAETEGGEGEVQVLAKMESTAAPVIEFRRG